MDEISVQLIKLITRNNYINNVTSTLTGAVAIPAGKVCTLIVLAGPSNC